MLRAGAAKVNITPFTGGPMAGYAGRVVTAESDLDSLVEGLGEGVALASVAGEVVRQQGADGVERDWKAAFAQVLDAVTAP